MLTTLQVALAQIDQGPAARRRPSQRGDEDEDEDEDEQHDPRGRAPSTAADLHSSELLSSLTHYASYFPSIASPPKTRASGSGPAATGAGAAAAGTGAGAEEEEHASDGMIHTHSSFSTGAHAVVHGGERIVGVAPAGAQRRLLQRRPDRRSRRRPPSRTTPPRPLRRRRRPRLWPHRPPR